MLKSTSWSDSRVYRSYDKHEPMEFYLKALTNSNSFDLLLGYFSSSAINVLSLGFARFIYNGGKVRIVANHILSKEDKNILNNAREGNFDSEIIDLLNIKNLKNSLDEYGEHFFNCISYLIANGRIEIVLVSPKKGRGLSHFKSGTFSDGADTIGFKASCNFTYSGITQNLEELDVFLLWENSRSSKLIESQTEYFENIFFKNADFVNYIEPSDVQIAIESEFNSKTIDELIVDEIELLKARSRVLNNPHLNDLIVHEEEEIYKITTTPRFPYPAGPRSYQELAFENWKANDKKGIFAMATGTGKTITALNCLYNEYLESGFYRAVIIVPTISLVEQWVEECDKFYFKNITTVSSKTDWTRYFSEVLTKSLLEDSSYIIIVTYASFPRAKFQQFFKKLNKQTLMIADEAHNLGSGSLLRILQDVHLKRRIGLSATINRKYDDVGNIEIQNFFQSNSPHTFEYPMKEALEKGVLCPYKYIPHIVYLNEEEQVQYLVVSKQLYKYIDSSTGRYKDCQEVTDLLMRRKRIIHKCENKRFSFSNILKEELKLKGNLKYTLVYAPEGKEQDFSESDHHESEEKLIEQYSRIVRSADDFTTVKQFTGATKNRSELLEQFGNGDIDVLISMKCLDEGVDVPRSELAIFCSSTGNPRQFVQRRGRVLRTHDDKKFATIHDLIVLPDKNSIENIDTVKGLIVSELLRVNDFASLAMNSHDSFNILEEELNYYGINLYNLTEEE